MSIVVSGSFRSTISRVTVIGSGVGKGVGSGVDSGVGGGLGGGLGLDVGSEVVGAGVGLGVGAGAVVHELGSLVYWLQMQGREGWVSPSSSRMTHQ